MTRDRADPAAYSGLSDRELARVLAAIRTDLNRRAGDASVGAEDGGAGSFLYGYVAQELATVQQRLEMIGVARDPGAAVDLEDMLDLVDRLGEAEDDLEQVRESLGEDDPERERSGFVCPLCHHVASSRHSLENGEWVFEPVENFGIESAEEGMVCAEWDSEHVTFYYHSPSLLDRGEIGDE